MINLIAKEAPDFSAEAVLENNEITNNLTLASFRGKYVFLFFYPLDFTFVCPTEILAFNERIDEFKKKDAVVLGISVDSVYSHLAWKKTPLEKGGIGSINFPLVSDLKKGIAKNYGVLHNDQVALRALFLIDKQGIIRHSVVNDLPFGRSVNEAMRMLDSLRHFDEYGKLCPADWEEGKTSMEGTDKGVIDYLSKFGNKS